MESEQLVPQPRSHILCAVPPRSPAVRCSLCNLHRPPALLWVGQQRFGAERGHKQLVFAAGLRVDEPLYVHARVWVCVSLPNMCAWAAPAQDSKDRLQKRRGYPTSTIERQRPMVGGQRYRVTRIIYHEKLRLLARVLVHRYLVQERLVSLRVGPKLTRTRVLARNHPGLSRLVRHQEIRAVVVVENNLL